MSGSEKMRLQTINQINSLVVEKGVCQCGNSLAASRMEMYDHKGGIHIKEKTEKQWVFFTCIKCGNQNAFWKIYKRILRSNLVKPFNKDDLFQ